MKVKAMLVTGALVLPLAMIQPSAMGADVDDKPAKAGTGYDADNTGRNARDASDKTVTPLDQGESEADRTITQEIRKAVVANDDLSMNAKNVKIITQNGVVTLRGPVKSPEEKGFIASVAKKTGGVSRVDDQLEIERN